MKTKKVLKIVIFIVILLTLIIVNSIYFTPHKLTIREETLSSSKIGKSFDDYIIAYFSDVHYGKYTKDEDIEKLVATINSVNPNVVIFGGDLFDDTNSINKEFLIEKLKSIKASTKKYAVLGECDNEETIEILLDSNFNILDNTNETIFNDEDFINVVGINNDISESSYEGITANNYTIAVSHCPDSFDKLDLIKTDYVLAGHSHGMQVYIPLINVFYREDGCKKYAKGKHYKEDTTLDITNGVGLKNKSIRLFSDAEVVFYKLKSK